jgi:hypothetical protein
VAKGQPESFAVTGKTRRPWVIKADHVSVIVAGQNNSNLTPEATPVADGGWELIKRLVPITVFIPF